MERLPYIAVLAAYALVALAHFAPSMVGETLVRRVRTVAGGGVILHGAAFVWALSLIHI